MSSPCARRKKAPPDAKSGRARATYWWSCPLRKGKECYFNWVEIELKLAVSAVPTPFTAAMIASAMPAAISPYSIAVAPDSSDKNFDNISRKAASF